MHPRAKKLAGCTNTYGPLEQLGIQNEEDEEDEDDNDAGRDELLLLGTCLLYTSDAADDVIDV